MTFSTETSTLLIVDFQTRLMPAIAGGDAVLANAERLARAARLLSVPVIMTEQNPEGLGPNAERLKALADRTFVKRHFDATAEPGWDGIVAHSRPDVVVAGCEAHVCVLQTVMGLRRLGHPVRLVTDAVGSRTAESRGVALDRARAHGASIVTAEMVIFEWLRTCDHPRFREVLSLVK